MDYQKELLLFIATTFVGAGATVLGNGNYLVGTGLLLLGALVFVGRGFYKKHIGNKIEKE